MVLRVVAASTLPGPGCIEARKLRVAVRKAALPLHAKWRPAAWLLVCSGLLAAPVTAGDAAAVAAAAQSGSRGGDTSLPEEEQGGQEDAGDESVSDTAAAAGGDEGLSDADGAGTSDLGGGGGNGGSLDFSKLQSSLQTGGVEGLNSMLKAFQGMNAMQGRSEAALHIKKDASGHEMYDFRDIDLPGVSSTTVGSAPLQVSLQPMLTTSPAPESNAMAAVAVAPSAELASGSRPSSGRNNGKHQRIIATAAAAPDIKASFTEAQTAGEGTRATKEDGQLIIWPPPPSTSQKTASRTDYAKSLPERIDQAAPAGVSSTEFHSEPQVRRDAVSIPPLRLQAVAVATSSGHPSLEVPSARWGNEKAIPVSTPVSALVHSAKDATNGDTVQLLTKGLLDVRQNLDTLLSEASSGNLQTARARSDGGALNAGQSQDILMRLQSLENQNHEMQRKMKEQAERLETLESAQKTEVGKLGQLENENQELRVQLQQRTVRSPLARLRSLAKHRPVLLAAPAKAEETHEDDGIALDGVRTFFHFKAQATE